MTIDLLFSQLISPGVEFWSIGGTGTGRLCRIRALAGLGLGVTHTGLGWSRGLLLRMLLAFSVAAEDRETSGHSLPLRADGSRTLYCLLSEQDQSTLSVSRYSGKSRLTRLLRPVLVHRGGWARACVCVCRFVHFGYVLARDKYPHLYSEILWQPTHTS